MTKAIVIGSGAGGSFAAMELAKAGWQVTVFEKGPNHFTNLAGQGPFGTVFANDSLAMLQRYFAEPDPEVFPRTWRPNTSAPAQYTGSVDELPQVVGGGTVHWDAKVPRFWDIDFQQRSALGPFPGADVADWPFTYDDLAPYYDEVEQLIGVQGDTATFPDLVRKHAPRQGQYPMPPGPQMRASTAVAAGAAAVGLHPFPFPMAANSVSGYNGQHACNNCGFCSSFGCPVVARPSALVPLRQALRTGRVELKPETMVTKVNLSGSRATQRQLGHDDRPRPRDRHRDRRRRGHGRVRHRDRPPRPALAVPRPQRQARPPADAARVRRRHRDLPRRADARLPRPFGDPVRPRTPWTRTTRARGRSRNSTACPTSAAA